MLKSNLRRGREARLLHWLVLCALAGAAATASPKSATAAWPPPEATPIADLANPMYWPNDGNYAYSSKDDGQWNYYSFIPAPSGTVMPRPQETASGMSIDAAWRYTIGDPSVVLAITDSGIKWDEDDLLEKAWINFKELANHKPTLADGTACGGTADLMGFDCNGDGVLTVSDYKDTPTLTPDADAGHPKGDKNRNGKLDAGDLILNFSDGIDDDNNGYIDDISGWDFMKNDNDPYDDTRYGHGTGEARDSVSQANNVIGSAGGCPLCRFMPMRVGDSFITDVNWFGKAVVYAADNGAKIIQCALGTINMNRFAQDALDYAYGKGVLTVTSMADENSRHHNMPAAANHTLPVHAIQFDGNSATESTTYFSFHPCSNFGGQNLLSAAGTGCSSEATGQLSGISGLLYSAALKYNVNPPLLPGEAQNIFFMTADDIDVPESREPDTLYRWSQKGFDQRFGYGRVNANRAVEAVRDGKIPPSVDIVSPRWFTVLYKDRVDQPIDILGTVTAPRATSFDYIAEWAPGVQPLDDQFQVFYESQKNIPGNMVFGSTGEALAKLDIRTIDPKHERDNDSNLGENDYTITVRIRAAAHYGGNKGDVWGEMRRTYYVYSDPTLAKGFPIEVGDSGEGSPKMADLDGDGKRELIYPTGGGVVHVLKLTENGPEAMPGFPFKTQMDDGLQDPAPTPTTPVYTKGPAYANKEVDTDLGREAIVNAPAIGDINGDGKQEIVVSTFSGTVYAIGSDGATLPGFPKRLPEVPSCPLDPSVPAPDPCMNEQVRTARGTFASPVLVDMNGDQKLDIIQAAFDGKIYVFDSTGADIDGWPLEIHYQGTLSKEPDKNRLLTTPAVGDFNEDGTPDLLIGSNERLGSGGQAGAAYLVDGRGTKAPGGAIFPNWPVSMTSLELFPLVAEGVPNSGVIARFDGKLAAIIHGNATLPLILPADPGMQPSLTGTPVNALPRRPDLLDPSKTVIGVDPSSVFGPYTKANTPNTMLPLFSQPSVADIDQDGTPDVIASGGSLNLAINLQAQSNTGLPGDHLMAVWSGKTGAMMPASPYLLEDFSFFNSQAVADLNGDSYPEILVGSAGYFLHAIDACGREPEGWPKFTGQWVIPTPALGDMDGDNKLEVAVGTRSGWLYVWHTDAAADSSVIEWESYHHDNQNTGNLETALSQGKRGSGQNPLKTEMCAPPAVAPGDLTPDGGCNCIAAGGAPQTPSSQGAGLFAALAALASGLWRRRRASASSPSA